MCTNRPVAATHACLARLRDLGLGPRVIVVLSAVAAELERAHRDAVPGLLPGAEVLACPAPGLSRARNAALERCAGAGDEVLAFIDDDALAHDGWFDALSGGWASAAEDVAAIGGPVLAVFESGRPEWLTDRLLSGVSAVDHGGEARVLHPPEEVLFGANMSFRVAAARAVGGFDPRLGHTAGREFFGEDDDVQVRLVAAGGRVLYLPEAGVDHLIEVGRTRPTAFLRRRLRLGISAGLRGIASPRVAAAHAPAAAGRGAWRAARRRPGPAMEDLDYAVRSAGVVWGSWMRRRESRAS